MSALSKEFDLTKENSFQTITFLANKMKYAPVTVGFNQAVPGTTMITLVGEDGQSQVLPAETYGKHSYGKKVVTGEYKVLVNLSNGYELLDNLQPFKVLFGKNNVLSLSVVSKLALIAALNKQMEVVKTPRYYNTKQNLKEMFEQSVKDAQLALGSKLNQDKIDQIVKALESAMQTLDGKESDITSLKNAIKAYAETVKKGKYINSDQERKGQYDREFKLLALLITKDLITQDEIDRLLTTFLQAQDQLNGKETDFMSLKNVIEDEVKFQEKDPRFLTASKEEKDAYHLIFNKAKLLLENAEASQEEINEVIKALKETVVKLKANKVEIPTKPVVPVKPVDPTKAVAPVNPVIPAKPVVTIKPVSQVQPVKLVSQNRQVSTIKPSISNDKIEKATSITIHHSNIEAKHENKTLAGSDQQVLLATVIKEGKQLPATGENNMISIMLSISGISLLLSVIGLVTFSKSE